MTKHNSHCLKCNCKFGSNEPVYNAWFFASGIFCEKCWTQLCKKAKCTPYNVMQHLTAMWKVIDKLHKNLKS